ncbi:MAG: alpha/beta hydrolase fold domain-containing protein, partial [Steroidobacteraceae bacterium]
MLRALLTVIALGLAAIAHAGDGAVAAVPEIVPLWPQGAPGSQDKSGHETVHLYEGRERIISNVHRPTVTVFLPEPTLATGAGVIVIPGGGHRELWIDHEGYNVARFLAGHGIAAFVLKYRLAQQPNSTYTIEGDELADVQRAIRLARSRAGEWKIDPERIGVIGFSAGGELAALAGARFDAGAAGATDPIERQSSRPGFQALFYPGSSQSLKVPEHAPPAFLVCGAGDRPQISEVLTDLYLALRRAGASAELHIYAGAGHGFGLRPTTSGPAAGWPQRFLEWLEDQGFTKKSAAIAGAGVSTVDVSRRRVPFNDGWRFFLGDASSAAQPGFDDSSWRPVRLPHDWAIEGPFDSKLNPHTGALP